MRGVGDAANCRSKAIAVLRPCAGWRKVVAGLAMGFVAALAAGWCWLRRLAAGWPAWPDLS